MARRQARVEKDGVLRAQTVGGWVMVQFFSVASCMVECICAVIGYLRGESELFCFGFVQLWHAKVCFVGLFSMCASTGAVL